VPEIPQYREAPPLQERGGAGKAEIRELCNQRGGVVFVPRRGQGGRGGEEAALEKERSNSGESRNRSCSVIEEGSRLSSQKGSCRKEGVYSYEWKGEGSLQKGESGLGKRGEGGGMESRLGSQLSKYGVCAERKEKSLTRRGGKEGAF